MTSSAIDAAITSRMSIRAFGPQAVPKEAIAALVQAGMQLPAGDALRHLKIHVLQGNSLESLCIKVCTAHDAVRADPALQSGYREKYSYYPEKWLSPYLDRRRENGWGLYGLLGIGKTDRDQMHLQHQRNYVFFNAPVGLMLTVKRLVGMENLLPVGRVLQNIMVAARLRGLHSCPQAAWNEFASIVLPHVGAEADDMLVCGMALGYADEAALVNSYYTPRQPVPGFMHWRG